MLYLDREIKLIHFTTYYFLSLCQNFKDVRFTNILVIQVKMKQNVSVQTVVLCRERAHDVSAEIKFDYS